MSDPLRSEQIREIRNYITQDKEEFKRAIFSNENISGTIPSFFRRGMIYPNIGKRVRQLCRINEGLPVELYFIVRSYDEFIASSYSEFIRARGFDVSFREYQDTVLRNEPNWVDVVQSVVAESGSAQVKVFQQSDIANNLESVLKILLGLDVTDLKQPSEFEGRRSLSESGMDVLALMAHYGYTEIEPEFVNRLAMILPSSKELGRPFRMSKGDVTQYKSLYAEHIDQLRNLGYLIKGSVDPI